MVNRIGLRMKWFATLISTTLVGIGGVFAGGEVPPSIDAKLDVLVQDNICIGEQFEVTFRFETLEQIVAPPDRPQIGRIKAPENAEYVKGDTIWEGILHVGTPVAIKATYVLRENKVCRFKGTLESLVLYTRDEMTDAPVYYRRHLNGATSALVGDSESNVVPRPGLVIVSKDSQRVTDGHLPSPTLAIPPGSASVRPRSLDSTVSKIGSPMDPTPNTDLSPILLKISPDTPDTIYVAAEPDREYRLSADVAGTRITVELERGIGQFLDNGTGTGPFQLESDTAIFIVTAGSIKCVLVVTTAPSF